ncbi:FecR family protein [Bacteroides sp. GM023]|uniref:FecR family protein n=1 Tax=Bacteroides sp. GM023 TaxID=2723058 RepID=UPI00168B9BD6|nr:FecR family protein [Bacteroides sp. GM023]MBD3589065.1 DUF4974 domain-containing protein [Bacteroides sp. GM023]
MKNYFQKILTLFTKNEYPKSTQQEFYRWLVDKEHASEKDEVLQKLWEEALKQEPSQSIHRSYEQLRKNAGIPSVRKERRIRPIHIWQVVAAVFFIVASSSVYLATIGKDAEPNLLQQYIPTAEMRTLTLPDGTKVQLNSQSTLLYPQEFTGKDRSVFLIGEANFKVKPDKKHPFIVKSNDFQVTALGTEFNVAAYPENPIVAATLISGSVLVEYNELNSQMILKPNEQLAYNRNNKSHLLSIPDMDDITAWQRGELVFREMNVQEIINVLERKYNYTFVYSMHELKQDRYSFRFRDKAPLNEVMDIVTGVVGGLKYRIDKDICFINKK